MRILITLFCALAACGTPTDTRPPAAEPVALGVVFYPNWYWIGNELYATSVDDMRVGAYQNLRIALDAAFSDLPSGSQTAILTYDVEPRVLQLLGPVPREPSRLLGPQRAYETSLGGDLVGGIAVGIDELARSPLRRKLLVVIGDGTPVYHDGARDRLAELRAAAERAGITPFAIVLPMLEGETPPPVLDAWTTEVLHAKTSAELVPLLRAIARSREAVTKV